MAGGGSPDSQRRPFVGVLLPNSLLALGDVEDRTAWLCVLAGWKVPCVGHWTLKNFTWGPDPEAAQTDGLYDGSARPLCVCELPQPRAWRAAEGTGPACRLSHSFWRLLAPNAVGEEVEMPSQKPQGLLACGNGSSFLSPRVTDGPPLLPALRVLSLPRLP